MYGDHHWSLIGPPRFEIRCMYGANEPLDGLVVCGAANKFRPSGENHDTGVREFHTYPGWWVKNHDTGVREFHTDRSKILYFDKNYHFQWKNRATIGHPRPLGYNML